MQYAIIRNKKIIGYTSDLGIATEWRVLDCRNDYKNVD